ncbi:hypothetical protein Pcinc_039054 [Petrolisthes cinctipes]|uniref:Uncharacterized protein n=1 Tax=Petrolisthes cinctipes TaxID=88211 RepID=A0AAE1EJE7_PETCI|nr:hypothetical protein Pcinc_039054 [Petrolisthes cinctipes]
MASKERGGQRRVGGVGVGVGERIQQTNRCSGTMHSTTPPHTKQLPRDRPLGIYTRSLNLLGVKVPTTRQYPREVRSGSSQSWSGQGRLQTQVKRRSTSLEDVTRAIPQVNSPTTLHTLTLDAGQRATLSQAVYEEWYFTRCRQIRSRKSQVKEESVAKEGQKEKVFLMWKKMKIKEEREKRMKEKMEKEERRRREEEEKRDKRRIADLSFEAWRREKRVEETECSRNIILASHRKKQDELTREEERSRSALEAYEAWLDEIDHREPYRIYEETKTVLMAQTRPPWCPGGSTNSLLGC